MVAEGFVQAFWLYQATHSAVESSASSMHRQGLPRLIGSVLHAASTPRRRRCYNYHHATIAIRGRNGESTRIDLSLLAHTAIERLQW